MSRPMLARRASIAGLAPSTSCIGPHLIPAPKRPLNFLPRLTLARMTKHGPASVTIRPGNTRVSGIRVNAVCPGVIRTSMVADFSRDNPGWEARVLSTYPMGRFGSPDEVANAVVWLCSDDASFITGLAIPVEGGRLA